MYLSSYGFLHHPLRHRRAGTRASGALLVVLCGVLFLDGLDVSMVGVALPSIQRRPRPLDLAAAVGRLRLRARLRRPAAARRPRRRPARPPPRAARRAGRVRRRVAPRRPGQRRHAADRHPLRQGRRAPRSPRPPASRSSPRRSPRARRATARSAIYTAIGASGFSLGLVLGGLLTELGWRWTFLLPVPVALAILVVAPALIPRDRPALARRAAATTSPAR